MPHRIGLVLIGALILMPCGVGCARADGVLIFAAASLQESLNDIADSYARAGRARPVISFSGSPMLARQIERGAPASIFISADEDWMDYLAARHLIVPETRRSLLRNRLALIAPAGRPFDLAIEKGFRLDHVIGTGRLAVADPEAVPAGRYAKAALVELGAWDALKPRLVRGENVRAALAFVERDEARAGIVYATDARISKKVVIVGLFPDSAYPPITYPIAVVAANDSPAARDLLGFIESEPSKEVFRRYGFVAD